MTAGGGREAGASAASLLVSAAAAGVREEEGDSESIQITCRYDNCKNHLSTALSILNYVSTSFHFYCWNLQEFDGAKLVYFDNAEHHRNLIV